jgi:hypothetical protein
MIVSLISTLGLAMGLIVGSIHSLIASIVLGGVSGGILGVLSCVVQRRLENTHLAEIEARRAITARIMAENDALLERVTNAQDEFHDAIHSAVLVRDVTPSYEVPGVTRAVVVALGSTARDSVNFDVGDEIFVETSIVPDQLSPLDLLLTPYQTVLAFTRSGVTTEIAS